MERTPITASEGMMLTNGTVYGKTIWLAEGMDVSEFYEITAEEYNAMMEEEARKAEEMI